MISEVLGSWVPRRVVEEARGLLPLRPSYLDVGCGDGSLTIKVANIIGASKVYGVDIDEKALVKASEKGVITFKCDLSKGSLPFNDSSFDIATIFEVIEHLDDPQNVLREVFRVLRKGGVMIVETPNSMGCVSRFVADQLKLIRLSMMSSKLTNYLSEAREARGFNPRSLRLALIEVGFEVLKIYGVSHPPIELPSIPVVVEEIKEDDISTIPHIIAVARKR